MPHQCRSKCTSVNEKTLLLSGSKIGIFVEAAKQRSNIILTSVLKNKLIYVYKSPFNVAINIDI